MNLKCVFKMVVPACIIIAVAGTAAFAQNRKWNLMECIGHARENNLQIRQKVLEKEEAGNNLTASKLNYLPSLNASVNHNMSWGRSVNLNDLQIIKNKLSQSTSANISASLPLFEGFKTRNTIKSNLNMLRLADVNIDKLKDEISIAIAKGYLQVLLSYEVEKSATASYNSLMEQVKRTKELVDAGTQAYSSLLEIQAQLANEKVQLVTAKNNVRSNILALAQLLDIDETEGFDIEIPDTDNLISTFIQPQADEIYSRAMDLPVIQGAELNHEQSKLQYKIQKGAAMPSISFNAGYGSFYSDNQRSPFFKQFDYNRNPSMGFGLAIPIFNNLQTKTAIKNARLGIKSSAIELEMAKQNLKKEIQQACNDAVSCYEKMKAAEQNLLLAKESFNYTNEKFNVGTLNGTDYSVAKNNLTKAESEYLQSKFQYIFQLKILDYYNHIPLTL